MTDLKCELRSGRRDEFTADQRSGSNSACSEDELHHGSHPAPDSLGRPTHHRIAQQARSPESGELVIPVNVQLPGTLSDMSLQGSPQYARQFELKYSGNCLMTSGS
jgi:hypothetical protein